MPTISDTNDVEALNSPETFEDVAQFEGGDDEVSRDINFNNPWVIAKLNTALRRHERCEQPNGSGALPETADSRQPILSSSPVQDTQVSQVIPQAPQRSFPTNPTTFESSIGSTTANTPDHKGRSFRSSRLSKPFVQPLRMDDRSVRLPHALYHNQSTDEMEAQSPPIDADGICAGVGVTPKEICSTNYSRSYWPVPIGTPRLARARVPVAREVSKQAAVLAEQSPMASGRTSTMNSGARQLRQQGMRVFLHPSAPESRISEDLQLIQARMINSSATESPEPSDTPVATSKREYFPSVMPGSSSVQNTHLVERSCSRRFMRSKNSRLPLENIPESYATKTVVLRHTGIAVADLGKQYRVLLSTGAPLNYTTGLVRHLRPFDGNSGDLCTLRAGIRDQLVHIQSKKKAIDMFDILKSVQEALLYSESND